MHNDEVRSDRTEKKNIDVLCIGAVPAALITRQTANQTTETPKMMATTSSHIIKVYGFQLRL